MAVYENLVHMQREYCDIPCEYLLFRSSFLLRGSGDCNKFSLMPHNAENVFPRSNSAVRSNLPQLQQFGA